MNQAVANIQPNPELTQVAVDYDLTDQGFIGDQIAPVVPVKLDQFRYGKWGREALKDIDRTHRAIGTPANEVSPLSLTYSNATVERYALQDAIADEILNNSANPTKFKNKRVQSVVRKLKAGVDMRLKTLIDASSNTSGATAAWDVAATTTIEKDIDTAKQGMRAVLGIEPNVMVINKTAANGMRRNATLRELIKYTVGPEWLKSGELPSVLFGMKVIVPGVQKDTAAPGAAAAVISDIWGGTSVYFLYVDSQADGETVTALAQFRNTVSEQAFAVREWRDPDQSAKRGLFSVEVCQKELQLTAEAVYVLTSTNS